MGSLAVDTQLAGDGDEYTAVLSPEWEVWGPNGGYLASIALRAAGRQCRRARPASIAAHFLGVAAFGPITVRCRTLRSTRVATSTLVELVQDDKPILAAMVWGVDDLPGLDFHITRRPPDVPQPDELPTHDDCLQASGRSINDVQAFYRNLDLRPIDWIVDWDNRPPGEPVNRGWYRFVPDETFDDPWLDSMRALILVDLEIWPSVGRGLIGDYAFYGPSVDVECRFHHVANDEPWLRTEGEASVGHDGLIGGSVEVWARDGRLVASGGSTLLCRPAQLRPDR
jgi:acyl-CoA thioesterase II